jgi:hypothetical protein
MKKTGSVMTIALSAVLLEPAVASPKFNFCSRYKASHPPALPEKSRTARRTSVQ